MRNQKRKTGSSLVKVLGPVDNLESYVKADWWKEIFNANYLRTDGDVVGDSDITRQEIGLIRSIINIKQDDFILDLCCGQGRHSLELARSGLNNVFGLDRSHYLIIKAKSQAKKEGYRLSFKEGDARKLPYPVDFFDFILLMGNSFGYFESVEEDTLVLKQILQVIKPSGTLLIDVTDGDYMRESFEPRSWEWIDQDYFVCRERSLSKCMNRLISREVITHTRKGVVADQFYAERLYSRQALETLLREAGFTEITMHNELSSDSRRNQDLGMMKKRIIVTAKVEKEWSKTVKTEKKTRTVAVLLGDPRQVDKVKPESKFDEDDFATIRLLQGNLEKITDYKFKYFDNHATLIQVLINNRKNIDFIFNLCDEGFQNEANKELHVPAFLEMLEIPYTGGTPQCLAFCYDKSLTRGVAVELELPVPAAYILKAENIVFFDIPLDFPVIVKPNLGDSSFGITADNVCYSLEQLEAVLVRLRQEIGYETNLLVEEFLTGKDLSVGIIGNLPDDYTVLPIIEEDYSDLPEDLPPICGYEAKWNPDSPYWKCLKSVPAELPEETSRYLVASCLKLFERLQCRDYARFDWRLDHNGTPRLLEVNPNPGWCWDGHLAKMAKFSGLSYKDMLQKILQSAENRLFPVK